MRQIIFSLAIILGAMGSGPVTGWAASAGSSAEEMDAAIYQLIKQVRDSTFQKYQKDRIADSLYAVKLYGSPIQKNYMIRVIRNILAQPDRSSRAYGNPCIEIFSALAKSDEEVVTSGSEGAAEEQFYQTIINDGTLDSLIRFWELPWSGSINAINWTHTLGTYYFDGTVVHGARGVRARGVRARAAEKLETLRWILDQMYALSNPHMNNLRDFSGILESNFMRNGTQAQIERLIEAVHTLIERTHLQGRPISQLGVLSYFLEQQYLHIQSGRFYQQILPRIIDRFNEQRRLGRLTDENEAEILLFIINTSGENPEDLNRQRIARRDMLAMGVHNYSDTSITEPAASETGSAACTAAPKKLNDAVLDNIRRRLETKKRAIWVSYEDAVARIQAEINKKHKKDRTQIKLVNQAIQDGFGGEDAQRTQEELKLAFNFMLFFHPDRMSLWIDQFIGESITAYKGRKNPLSCRKGTTERLITGLRGIDPELDALFAQAEGPATMQAIITMCNFGDFGERGTDDRKAKFVAKKLIELGYKANTSPPAAGELFKKFLIAQLHSLNIKDTKKEKDFLEQIDLLAETVEGDLERRTESILKARFKFSMKDYSRAKREWIKEHGHDRTKDWHEKMLQDLKRQGFARNVALDRK